MESEFKEAGFKKYFFCKGMRSVAGQFGKNNRCGIYILHFSNGEYYVGLAVDVVRRYAQHRVNHSDIEYVSFKEVPKNKLAEVEKETVYKLENLNKRLRNINIVSIIAGDTDFDLIVNKEEQKDWLNNAPSLESMNTERFDYPDLRKKYTKNFEKLKKNKDYKDIIEILQAYVIECIPFPKKTEYSFWSLSCLPSTGKKVLFRVNIFWQETFVFYEEDFKDEETGQAIMDYTILIWLSKKIFEEKFLKNEFEKKFKTLDFVDANHFSGGQDQLCARLSYLEFFEFFDIPEVNFAIKDFNLRLIRKGGCMWNRNHCFDLADEALRTDNIEWEELD
jgi:predicted GIY-YIG superfamily endonuclease